MELLDLYLKALKEIYPKVEIVLTCVDIQYYANINIVQPCEGARFNTVDTSLERALRRSADMFLNSTSSKSAWTRLNEHIHKGP